VARHPHAAAATPATRHDLITFDKMPAKIGAQRTRCWRSTSSAIRAALRDGASRGLGAFYASKRSSSTRRRDRTKLKRLGELGPVKFVNPDTECRTGADLRPPGAAEEQGLRAHGRAEPVRGHGHAAFYRELATSPRYRSLVHLSRLDVGPTWAALNLGLTFRDCYFHILASYGRRRDLALRSGRRAPA
jgi:CelD/BcsL family acetyltransferase involved in cellulose biosynthesis